MIDRKMKIATIIAVIAGVLIIGFWLWFSSGFLSQDHAPITQREYFLLKMETEIDNMRMLLALRTNMGFTEAQDPAERIRDLCYDVDREAWKKWSIIVEDINSWYIRLVVEQTATLDDVLNELYAKYPFLKLEGVMSPPDNDRVKSHPADR